MRKDIDNKKDSVLTLVCENKPKAEICRFLQCKPETLDSYLKKWGIEYKGNSARKGIKHLESRTETSLYLSNDRSITSHKLKLRLIEEGYKEHRCECCNLTEWLNEPIPIELHHINGDRFNNNLDNLQILCPNCHSKTDNNSGKGTLRVKEKVKQMQ